MKTATKSLLTAVALIASLGGAAPAGPSQVKIEEARRSLVEMADASFVEYWKGHGDAAAADGVDPAFIRQSFRWIAPAYSLGMCHEFASPTEYADWLTGLDNFAQVLDGAQEYRRDMLRQGKQLYQDGVDFDWPSTADAPYRTRFCAIELAAVRQYMGGNRD